MQHSPNIGFFTVVVEPAGYVGGYLATNCWGRPLEFRLCTPIQPNRVQRILYGPTLAAYVYGELIGKTLVDKAQVGVDLIVTDAEPALNLRPHVGIPVVWLAGVEAVGEVGNVAGGDARKIVHHLRYPADEQTAARILQKLDAGVDLAEPFSRIREALAEARKMGAVCRAA